MYKGRAVTSSAELRRRSYGAAIKVGQVCLSLRGVEARRVGSEGVADSRVAMASYQADLRSRVSGRDACCIGGLGGIV